MAPSPENPAPYHVFNKPLHEQTSQYPPHHWLQETKALSLLPGEVDADIDEPAEADEQLEELKPKYQQKLQALGRKAIQLVQGVAAYGEKFNHDDHPKFIEYTGGDTHAASAAVEHGQAAPWHPAENPGQPESSYWYLPKPETTAEVAPDTEANEVLPFPLDRSEVLDNIERQHFVKEAPRFAEMIDDESRTNSFKYVATRRPLYNQEPAPYETVKEVTEHEGLGRLHGFLSDFLSSEIKTGNGSSEIARKAKGMLDNLTFIGNKEYQEATQGLAMMWKAYLDENQGNQLCVPSKISQQGGKRKSDIYLLENILNSFTDEELARYEGRIVTDISQISRKPEQTRIVLLDDWTISGSQLRDAYAAIKNDKGFSKYADRVEVNLLVGSANRLQDGLVVKEAWSEGEDETIPVKAYYKAHDATTTSDHEHKAHVTGTHSSVDYDFEVDIANMRGKIEYAASEPEEDGSWPEVKMPPLSNVIRSYRYAQPLMTVEKGGRIRRNKV